MSSKVVLITGCSSGFGMLTAARLSQSGHKVYAGLRDLKRTQNLFDELEKRKTTCSLIELDVTQDSLIENAIQRIESTEGRLDVLVNNAGYGVGGYFEDLSEQEIRDQFETNFFGVLKVIRHALPLMRKTGSGKIINVSSISGHTAMPAVGAYSSSKWALEGMSEALRFELRPANIQVVLVEPGMFETNIQTKNLKLAEKSLRDEEGPHTKYAQKMREKFESIRKNPNAEQVAAVIEKIIRTRHPKFRNFVGLDAKFHLAVRSKLPYRVYEEIVWRSIFGWRG